MTSAGQSHANKGETVAFTSGGRGPGVVVGYTSLVYAALYRTSSGWDNSLETPPVSPLHCTRTVGMRTTTKRLNKCRHPHTPEYIRTDLTQAQ